MFKKRSPLTHAVAAAALLFGFACSESPPETGEAAGAAVEVDVIRVTPAAVSGYIEHVGTTESKDTVEIRARVEGFIESRLFQAGDNVRKGQVLYRIDPRTYEANLDEARANLTDAQAQLVFAKEGVELLEAEFQLSEAEANLAQAERDIARLKPLAEEEAVSEQDLDAAVAAERVARAQVEARRAAVQQQKLRQQTDIEQAQAAVERVAAALRRSELDVEWTEIRSPVRGRIGESVSQVGALVTPNSPEPLTYVSPLDPISVDFQVSERDYLGYIKGVRTGQHPDVRDRNGDRPYELLLSDGTTYPHRGWFRSVERGLDTESGTLEVTANFPNPDRELIPGQFARVRLDTGSRSGVFLIPQRAVQQMQGVRSVLLVGEGNVVVARTVTLGEQRDDQWVVESGLAVGDVVIVDGLQRVRPGSRVNPIESINRADATAAKTVEGGA